MNELTQRTVGQNPAIDLTYDDAGNLTQDGDSDGDHKYVWDYRNRLIEVQEKQSGTWTTIAEYTYDAKNRRVVKEVTNKGDLNGTTRFVWGGQGHWQCLEERDGSGSLVARFVYSPGYIDAVARQERDLNADDDFGDSDEVVWYHPNTLYSIYALSDASENVTERYRYDAYGRVTVLDADGSTGADGASDVDNPYVFTARRLDIASDLMQYRNRYYAAALGRFISRDPQGYADSTNLHCYARARPGFAVDPRGLMSILPPVLPPPDECSTGDSVKAWAEVDVVGNCDPEDSIDGHWDRYVGESVSVSAKVSAGDAEIGTTISTTVTVGAGYDFTLEPCTELPVLVKVTCTCKLKFMWIPECPNLFTCYWGPYLGWDCSYAGTYAGAKREADCPPDCGC